MYPRIGFFEKMTYSRIRIGPIPIRVSVSVLHSSVLIQVFLCKCAMNHLPNIGSCVCFFAEGTVLH